MMDLREPKKKKRVRLQDRPPLPTSVDENGEWRVYTAHLSASGTCIVDPVEMEAVYSMGFFGKGSLSRSFPSYGRRRFGVPPIVRNRQWVRRQQWLDELESLNDESNRENLEMTAKNDADVDSSHESVEEESSRKEAQESSPDTPVVQEETVKNGGGEAVPKVNAPKDAEVPSSSKSRDEDEKKKKEEEEGSKATEASHDSSIEVLMEDKPADTKMAEETKVTNRQASNTCSEPSESEEKECPAKRARTDVTDKPNIDEREDKNTRDDTMDVDKSQLNSTEDEEICEIVEEAPERSSSRDDALMEKSPNENGDETNHEVASSLELLVLPDTDDEDTDNYLNTVKPRIEIDKFPVNETLHLTFEETFFLMYGLGCLQLLYYDGSIFSNSNAWNYFQQQDKYFVQKYIVYHYFRSKGWVVKPGMKFGGDFLLYKQGPPFYHASYIVVIEVMDADTLVRDDAKSLRTITWKNLNGLERLSETISKEILFAQILWPSTIIRNGDSIPVEALAEFTVRELLWRRWNPKRKQDIAALDEEDSDSM